eukprot:CAMPEP_0172009438 /NCGR_PEP_ID=MMETSP1041-20130122/7185_1 /TAXON_ID=464988 /ORGANISM="Hemiselmis andersenii, Strain CCMP439" /LENGTH=105 /DNA_ID=CAMNT_0012663709 /DNA_START=718 /DNA_END=1035 /DNA_ORIENTATION=-
MAAITAATPSARLTRALMLAFYGPPPSPSKMLMDSSRPPDRIDGFLRHLTLLEQSAAPVAIPKGQNAEALGDMAAITAATPSARLTRALMLAFYGPPPSPSKMLM